MAPKAKGTGGAIVTDPRFAAVHSDPRFQRFPKANRKVEIDERFAGMFSDPNFQVRSAVDKRGRKVKARKNEDMRRYYRLKDEDDRQTGKEGQPPAEAAVPAQQPMPPATQAAKAAPLTAPGAATRAAGFGQNGAAVRLEGEAKAKGKTGKRGAKGKQSQKMQGAAGLDEEDSEAEPSSDEPQEHKLSRELEEDDESGSDDEEDDEAAKRWARLRGLDGADSSSEEEEDEEGEEWPEDLEAELEGEEDPAAALAEWGVGALAANPEEQVPEVEQETHRLAVLDLDWERTTAVDILAVLNSFLGRGQTVRSVTVYPSDYGLQRMAEEAVKGPQAIFNSGTAGQAAANGGSEDQGEAEEDDVDSEDEEGISEDSQDESSDEASDPGSDDSDMEGLDVQALRRQRRRRGGDSAGDDSDSGAEVDPRRLQMYERSKLRWYYAVVDCDSAATASRLYAECDGMEFLRSACKFDLRYVPDEQSFEGRQVRDSAAEVPANYTAPDFTTGALQQTNVKLTWDAEAADRKKALGRRVTEDELREDDFKAYLGSESDDEGPLAGAAEDAEEEDPEAVRERYRRLLLGGAEAAEADRPAGRAGGKAWGGGSDDDEEASSSGGESEEEEKGAGRGAGTGTGRHKERGRDKDQEMVVTFVPGLEGVAARAEQRRRDEKARASETVWEAYLRRRREKKKAKQALGKANASSSDGSDSEGGAGELSDDDMPADVTQDPFFQHEADPFDDPFFNDANEEAAAAKAKTGGGKAGEMSKEVRQAIRAEHLKAKEAERKENEEARKKEAELELLMLDESRLAANGAAAAAAGPEGDAPAPAASKKLSRKARLQAKRRARLQERQYGSDEEDAGDGGGFQVNLSDPRFQQLFTSHLYALDPTDPRFPKSEAARQIVAETVKRRGKRQQQQQQMGQAGGPAVGGDASEKARGGSAEMVAAVSAGRSSLELKAMVAKLKRKAGQNGAAGPEPVDAGRAKRSKEGEGLTVDGKKASKALLASTGEKVKGAQKEMLNGLKRGDKTSEGRASGAKTGKRKKREGVNA